MTERTSDSRSPSVDLEPIPARYAAFSSRFRAVVIDTAIVTAGLVVVLVGGEYAEGIPGSSRVAWFLMFALLFLYEPLLIWRRGATIGHSRNHLRVVTDGTGRRPGLARSFARYLIKVVLGLPSFVTMALTRKHQAVHDILTRTTVQLAPNAGDADQEFYVERVDGSELILPSRLRRAVMMVVYLVGIFFLYGIVAVAIDPQACASEATCAGGRRILFEGAALLWLALSLAVIVAAWKGLLPGARRVALDEPPEPERNLEGGHR